MRILKFSESFKPKRLDSRAAVRQQSIQQKFQDYADMIEKALLELGLPAFKILEDYYTTDDNIYFVINTKKIGKSSLEEWYNIEILNLPKAYQIKISLLLGSINHSTKDFELGTVYFNKDKQYVKTKTF